MNVSQIISTLPLFFICIAAVSSLSAFRFNFPLSLKLLSCTWTFMLLTEVVGHLLQARGIRNHWLYNVFNPSFYILLAIVYRRVIENPLVKRIIDVFYVVFPLFILANSFFIQGIGSLQTLTIVIGGSFIILLACAYFWQLYQSESTETISRDPFFWFSFGFILYFGGTLPYLGMLNYLWKLSQEFTRFYFVYFYNVFSIVLNLLVTIGFLCRRSSPKLS